ncbi:hypothetical protein HJ170_22810 [Vibrio parahaemolyticus]|nr:hypothetical protein [Vibrio parahaemolyticus]
MVFLAIAVSIYGYVEWVILNVPSPYSSEYKARAVLSEAYSSRELNGYEFFMCMENSDSEGVVDCRVTLHGIPKVEKYQSFFSESKLVIEPLNKSAKRRGWRFSVESS